MSQQRLNDLIRAASARGILPHHAQQEDITRPWPIVLMSALGAWLVAIPFAVLVIVQAGNALNHGPMAYFLGAVFLAMAILALQIAQPGGFIEQMALPSMLVASYLFALRLYQDLPHAAAGALLALLFMGMAWIVRQQWLRVLLGALACVAVIATVSNNSRFDAMQLWGGLQCVVLVWVAATLASDRSQVSGANASRMIVLESAAGGWIVVALLGLAYASGKTFIVGAGMGSWAGDRHGEIVSHPLPAVVSLAMAVAAGALLARRWPVVRAPRMLAAAALCAMLAWLMPLLGSALLVIAICLAGSRWLLATAAGVTAAWIVGSFYYQLNMPLATKGLVMVVIGAGFGVLGWMDRRGRGERPVSVAPAATLKSGILVTLLATLIIGNGAIWQKENLISNGRVVFIELAPVDPRSLMQGDYMALNFRFPKLSETGRRAKVIARLDANGIAALQREANDQTLAPDELLIELPRHGNAWYFKEGEAQRWAKARYGEFRVDGDGRALLVNLRGENLEKM
ncbi:MULTISPECIES: GDYXXLXY domain-containing protein [unclassified Duganella]|uniref:GDYXXLXY domain-containing protein n=1 Tax=unclassified Duganella TaxID=2636909 RepID=UPI0008911C89|nr:MULTISPECIES: GDYXXLXY domain-containing protein [unclassified Duganella]SDH46157.1 Uncharacterized membrane-anchored protein [Duganella sp. OV458]SDK56400.1 Uncharacterized membrane-anchored protein [Duganella sp. OV510]